jgi:hypothetical protein
MATPHELPAPGPGAPTPPNALAGEAKDETGHLGIEPVRVPPALVEAERSAPGLPITGASEVSA